MRFTTITVSVESARCDLERFHEADKEYLPIMAAVMIPWGEQFRRLLLCKRCAGKMRDDLTKLLEAAS